MNDNENLFAALRAAFPADLDRTAIETDTGLCYRWRDLERASAMIANLLVSLELPGSPDAPPIVAAHTDKSVEALLLYLATLRAGYVYLPLNNAYQQAELKRGRDHLSKSAWLLSLILAQLDREMRATG